MGRADSLVVGCGGATPEGRVPAGETEFVPSLPAARRDPAWAGGVRSVLG